MRVAVTHAARMTKGRRHPRYPRTVGRILPGLLMAVLLAASLVAPATGARAAAGRTGALPGTAPAPVVLVPQRSRHRGAGRPLPSRYPPPKRLGKRPRGASPADWAALARAWKNLQPYQRVFFRAYPHLLGKVVVHHAIEKFVLQQTWRGRPNPYYGMFTDQEIHRLGNLRGIPKGRINSRMHNATEGIRGEWNRFYAAHPTRRSVTKADFHKEAARIDLRFGTFFANRAGNLPRGKNLRQFNALKAVGEAVFNPDKKPISTFPGFVCSSTGSAGTCSARSATNGLARALARPGGIDLSSLQLRYLSDRPTQAGRHDIGYAFSAPTSGAPQHAATGLHAARTASDAFFVWLALPPSTFWVNLNPTEPDRIIDRQFGRTDAGRILLQADLRMKKTVGKLIHPGTRLGHRFWARLRSGDPSRSCFSSRLWITPARATVYTHGDELYILKAPLKVNMEQQYLRSRGVHPGRSCPRQPRAIDAHNEALYRRLVLPRVQRAVNHGPEFAALRRVYRSRVAAQWYREQTRLTDTAVRDIVVSGRIGRWASHGRWRPRQTFRAYVHSYRHGEFHVTTRRTRGRYIWTNTYTYGGVDLSSVPLRHLSPKAFRASHRTLPGQVRRAMVTPRRTSAGRVLLAGAGLTAVDPSVAAAQAPVVVTPSHTPGHGRHRTDRDRPPAAAAGQPRATQHDTGAGIGRPIVRPIVLVVLVLLGLGLWLLRRARRRQ